MVQLLVIAVVSLLLVSCGAVPLTYDLGNLNLEISGNEPLRLYSSRSAQVGRPKNFEARLGLSFTPEALSNVKVSKGDDGRLTRVDLGDSARVEIDYPNLECVRLTTTTDIFQEIRDCVDYGTADWYGGPQQRLQEWPIQKLKMTDYSYVTKEEDNMGLAERLWINSEGVYLYVVPEVPLFIDSNSTGGNNLCFVAKVNEPYVQGTPLTLRYSICTLQDAKSAQNHAMVVSRTNALPRALPDERMVEKPIWSTWARYKRPINESVVMEFANEIISNGFTNSQLEIDDLWETCYGELTFDLSKFPDPAGLSRTLKDMGFRVTLWVHPFVNSNCPSFDAWKQAGYFVKDSEGNVITQWWNGDQAGIVDFTNPAAASWFVERLLALKSVSEVDSFKYDAGESGWLPKPRILNAEPALQPNIYSSSYVRALDVPELGAISEVRSGFETQDLPVFVRMIDKDTHWGIDNGLRSLITTLLSMNMVGYPIVLPDMIGGNGYGSDVISSELFIRWLQATTFMPSLQFSYVPWQFNDPEVIEISQKFVDLHANYTSNIMAAMQDAIQSGLPVNPPVFYASPLSDDLEVFAINDAYMLGRDLLVAPVLDEGATSRDIFIPEGTWTDMNLGTIYEGPMWLRGYPAPLDVLPYFTKFGMSASASSKYISFILLLMPFFVTFMRLL